MNKLLRYALFAGLFLTMFLPGSARAQQGGNVGAPPAGAPDGGFGGRGRGNGQGGPPPNGSAPNGGANRHGAPPSAAAGAPGAPASAAASAPPKAAAPGEQFYIVSSIDPQKQEVLLKRPTEVTLLMKIGTSTQIVDETGMPLKMLDLRAGDTVWVTSSGGAAEPTAVRIRKGQMTVADLHRFYLDYGPIK
jgi:hypothetical protein